MIPIVAKKTRNFDISYIQVSLLKRAFLYTPVLCDTVSIVLVIT